MRTTAPAIYVETRVRCDMERLWTLTQEPAQHQRWDLRFTQIDYLPRPDPSAPQHFRYAVRLLPGVSVAGVGTTLGERSRAGGSRTCALGFGSDSVCSLIRQGRGYWRYVPTSDGIRFLTGSGCGWRPVRPRSAAGPRRYVTCSGSRQCETTYPRPGGACARRRTCSAPRRPRPWTA